MRIKLPYLTTDKLKEICNNFSKMNDDEKANLLFLAIDNHCVEVVKLLIEKNIDIFYPIPARAFNGLELAVQLCEDKSYINVNEEREKIVKLLELYAEKIKLDKLICNPSKHNFNNQKI